MTTPNNDTVGSRNLPFPLKNPEASENAEIDASAILNLTPDMFPEDSDERITVQFDLSLNEFVALASALDVGRDPAYGIESYKIWWIWIRSFVGLPNINDCEDVADCVESELVTNQTLVNSITQTNINNGFGNANHANPDLTTIPDRNLPQALDNPIFTQAQCDLNALWGGIREGIVQRMDDNARTVLENLAAINDVPERLQTLLDTIPVLGDLAEFFVTNLTQVIPDLKNLYEAHSSIANMDEIACALFDLVCSECRYPTFNEVLTYYKSLGLASGEDIAELTLQMVTDFVTGSAVTAAQVAYFTIQTWQLFTWYIQATFNNQSGSAILTTYAHAGEDFGSDNWQDLCDGCDDAFAVATYDYRNEQGNSYKTTGYSSQGGTYVQGQGWRVDKINATGGRLTVAQPINPSWQIRAVAYQTSVPRADIVNFAGSFRPIAGSESGATGINWSIDSSPNPNARCRNSLVSISGFMEFALSLIKDPITEIFLEKIIIIYNKGHAPSFAIPNPSQDACAMI